MRVRSSPKFVDRSRAFQNLSLHHSTFVCNFLFPLLRTFFRRTPAFPAVIRVAIRTGTDPTMQITTQHNPSASQSAHQSTVIRESRRKPAAQRRNPRIFPPSHANYDATHSPNVATGREIRTIVRIATQHTFPTSQPVYRPHATCRLRHDPPPNRHHSLHELFRSY